MKIDEEVLGWLLLQLGEDCNFTSVNNLNQNLLRERA